MTRSFVHSCFLGAALCLSVVLAVPAFGLPLWLPGGTQVATVGPQNPGTMSINATQLEANSESTVENPDGTFTFMNGSMMVADVWRWTWDSITLDYDPAVAFVGGFTNLSEDAEDFVFSVSTPIAPPLAGTLYGGSTIVTYGDASFDGSGGLANDTSINPAYSGTIDGNNTLDMLTALSLLPDFKGDATKSASETQGLPGPTISGPAANSTIGILHRFNLSPGDQATFNSTFQVVIPEPSTFVLLASGLGGFAWLRRHRRL
jgi:hypothetical protein